MFTDSSGNVENQCPVEFVINGRTMTLSLLSTSATCTVSPVGISVGSEVVTVTLTITFPAAATYTVTSDTIDASGLVSPIQNPGTWTVTATPAISGFSPISATQGTPLTIYGSGFAATQGTVQLGGAAVPPANITNWSPGAIALTVPSNAVSGAIAVTAGNLTASSASPFQFVPPDFTMSPPSPSAITVYPTNSTSGGFADVISGANFVGTINLSYSVPSQVSGRLTLSLPSSLSGPGTFTATATASTATPQGTYNLTVNATGTKSDGTLSTHSVTVQVTVTGPPAVTMSSPSPSPVIVSSSRTVTFTQTVTAVNGFTGTFGLSVPANPTCWGGSASFPSSVTLTAANPSQTVTGTIVSGSNLNNSTNVYDCEVDASNGFFAPNGTLSLYVPVQLTAAGTFTVSGPAAPITLYANSTATPVSLQINQVNEFSGNVTFTTPTTNVTVQGSINVNAAQTTAPITVQWTFSALPTANPIPITILANSQAVLTILANVLPNPGTTFTLTSSPSSQSTNASGGATFQINVNASSAFTGNVTFSATGLPAGSYSFAPSTVTGPGATALIVTPPAVTATTVYPVIVTGNSGNTSAQTTASLTVNPPGAAAPATMLLPQPSPGNSPTLPLFYPIYTWTAAVKASQINLSVGRSPGGTDFGSTSLAPSTTQFKQPVSLPGDGSQIWVRLGSLINGAWQNLDYSYTSQCHGSGGGDIAPSLAVLEPDPNGTPATILNNGMPVSYTFYPNVGSGYNFTLGQGCSAGSAGPGVTAVPSWPDAYGDGGFTVTFQANETAASGLRTVTCNWVPQDQNEDNTSDFSPWVPLAIGDLGNLQVLQVYDATPSISSAGTSEVLYAGDKGDPTTKHGTVLLVITGANFGASGQLAFCPTGTTCSASSPACDGQIGSSIDTWSPGYITAWLTAGQNAGTSYDVMVISNGVNGLGNGFFQAGGQTTSKSSNQQTGANPTQPLMHLEMANPTSPTVISADGNYSENTTIKVTAVQADGTPISDWSGVVNLYEDNSAPGYITVYNVGSTGLPETVAIPPSAGGSTTFVAKSVAASPDGRNPPNQAKITTRNVQGLIIPGDYVAYGGSLPVPQWIATNTIDTAHATSGTYDWVAARARDIFTNYSAGDVATILAHVQSYSVAALTSSNAPPGTVVAGETVLAIPHQNTVPIVINPYAGYQMRNDNRTGVGCGYSIPKYFTGTFIHEGRHTYQGFLGMFNDTDGDYLIYSMPPNLPDASTIIDSEENRTVCNPFGSPMLIPGSYQGDTNPDPLNPANPSNPGNITYVSWAIEQDAYAWVASVLGP